MPDEKYKEIFSKNLKKYMRLKDKRQQDFIKDLGVSSSTISMWVNGKRLPRMGRVQQIADYLGIETTDLLEENNSYKIQWEDNVKPIKISDKFIKIPVLGTVPAGVPVEAVQDFVDTVDIPAGFVNENLNVVALKVQGNSMYPFYLEGDTVIVELRYDCESGQDAIVYVNGYDATLKTVIKNADGTITLKPRNPEWQAKIYGPDDEPIKILGPVIRQIR